MNLEPLTDRRVRSIMWTAQDAVIFWGTEQKPRMQSIAQATVEQCQAELERRKARANEPSEG